MRKLRIVLLLAPLVIGTLFLFINIQVVSGVEEEWEGKGPEWFYDNLTAADRKKIRNAFDYAIPRDQIIDGLHKGYAVPIASEVGQNVMGYDPSVVAREYNITTAKALMNEVFGKEYSNDAEEGSETITIVPYFDMTIISPTTNVARTQWAALISRAFQDIGVDVTLKWWNWNIIMPRLFLDPPKDPLGRNYEHGGYDAYFVGMGSTPDPDYSTLWYRSNFAPAGDNSQWMESDELEEIINRSLTSTDPQDRLDALAEYQAWIYDESPKSMIRQMYEIFAVDDDLEGFDAILYGWAPWANNITIGTQNTFTGTVPGDFVDFNVWLTNSFYDSVVIANMYMPLAYRRGMHDLETVAPLLAESWTSSADGLVWDVTLRQGVKWSDGTEVTAEDVVWTWHQVFDDALASTDQGFQIDKIGNASKVEKTGDYTFRFTLKAFYPYVETQILDFIPLQKAEWKDIPLADWKTSKKNLGTEATIGNGPYKWDNYDGTGTVKLVKNDLYDETFFHNVTDGAWFPEAQIDTLYFKVVKEATLAVTGLIDGTYDLLDSQTGVFGQIEQIEAHADTKALVNLEYGWQELCYNMYDSRYGYNPRDPREMYPEDYGTAPFDLTSVFVGILLLATIQVIIRNKRKKK